VESWPQYEYAWHAQFFVGDCCEKLKSAGTLVGPDVDARIENAYRAVVENYPNCRSAGEAVLRLGRLFYEKRNWMEAAKCLESFLLKNDEKGDARMVLDVLTHLALVYEKMGQHDAARQVGTRLANLAGSDDPRVQLVQAHLRRPQEMEVQE